MLFCILSAFYSSPIGDLLSLTQFLHLPSDGLLLLLQNSPEGALLGILDIFLCDHLLFGIGIPVVLFVSLLLLFLLAFKFIFSIRLILLMSRLYYVLLQHLFLLDMLLQVHLDCHGIFLDNFGLALFRFLKMEGDNDWLILFLYFSFLLGLRLG